MKSDSPIEAEALTIDEFCRSYKVGKTKTYEVISSGALKTRLFGRRRIILIRDARAYIETLPSE
jgi:hypothetical protein